MLTCYCSRVAAVEKAEAEKVQVVKAAEADAEVSFPTSRRQLALHTRSSQAQSSQHVDPGLHAVCAISPLQMEVQTNILLHSTIMLNVG